MTRQVMCWDTTLNQVTDPDALPDDRIDSRCAVMEK